ncbi:MAG: hypothetical protein CME32_27695 [Gimesia sp.]|nr:hypothetical protein [Gimesia sp.]
MLILPLLSCETDRSTERVLYFIDLLRKILLNYDWTPHFPGLKRQKSKIQKHIQQNDRPKKWKNRIEPFSILKGPVGGH